MPRRPARSAKRTTTASRPWTDADIRRVRKLAGTMPRREIAELLGRSDSALGFKAHKLRLSLEQKNRKLKGPKGPGARRRAALRPSRRPLANAWSAADLRFLRQNAGKMSLPQLSRRLGRTPGGITFKAFQMRLSLRHRPKRRAR
jgi:hypothetical protein